MPTAASLTERPAAIRVDLGAIFVSMELSRSKWLITSLSPGGGQKMSKHIVAGGDLAGLLNLFAALQAKARARTSHNYRTVVIQEAGLDGFWIHRALEREGTLGLKDVRLALAAGEASGVPLPFASVVRDNMIDAIGHGDADKDWSALALVARRRAGLQQ